jgi:hypothetical protein
MRDRLHYIVVVCLCRTGPGLSRAPGPGGPLRTATRNVGPAKGTRRPVRPGRPIVIGWRQAGGAGGALACAGHVVAAGHPCRRVQAASGLGTRTARGRDMGRPARFGLSARTPRLQQNEIDRPGNSIIIIKRVRENDRGKYM